MAYTLLLKNDNSVIATERQTIIQRSNLVDVLNVVVPRFYDSGRVDMSTFYLVMEYVLPISRKVRYVTMKLVDEDYKDGNLLYKLDIKTDITSENGPLNMHFSFMKNEITEDGTHQTPVREFLQYTLNIVPLQSYLTIPDDAVSDLAQMYLAGKSQIEALEKLVDMINQNKADDIKLDVENGTIHLTSNGEKVGTDIDLEQLGDELSERTASGLVKVYT